MLKPIIVVCAGLMLVSGAARSDSLADQEIPTTIVVDGRRSVMKTYPTESQGKRLYPKVAKHQRVAGMAQIACLWNEAGRLKCRAEHESPEGYGFGAAAVNLFEKYGRMDMKKTTSVSEEGKFEKRFRYYWGG